MWPATGSTGSLLAAKALRHAGVEQHAARATVAADVGVEHGIPPALATKSPTFGAGHSPLDGVPGGKPAPKPPSKTRTPGCPK